jgi:hypothetical protein
VTVTKGDAADVTVTARAARTSVSVGETLLPPGLCLALGDLLLAELVEPFREVRRDLGIELRPRAPLDLPDRDLVRKRAAVRAIARRLAPVVQRASRAGVDRTVHLRRRTLVDDLLPGQSEIDAGH